MHTHNLSKSQLEDVFKEVEEIEQFSPDIDDDEVIWKPHPGSQEFFLTCTVDECLLSGPRGTGKTDVLLMDFAKDCGIGYGYNWRGVLLRQTYKQLADVIVKSRKWFPKIFPGIEFNKAELVWTWPTGETLMLSYMDNPSHYETYHGWEIPWCVSHDTKVRMYDGTTKLIRDIEVGEKVMTLEGPKPVLRVKHSFKEAVEASFFSDDGQLLGTQIQGEEHQLLSIDGMHNGCSQGSLNEAHPSSQIPSPWFGYKSLQDYRQRNLLASLSELNQGSFSELNYNFAISEYFCKSSSYLFQIFLRFLEFRLLCMKNIQFRNSLLGSEANFFSHISDRIFHPKESMDCNQEFQRLLLYYIQSYLVHSLHLHRKMEDLVLDCGFHCGVDEKLIRDFLLNHFFCSSRNDGRSHLVPKNDQDSVPLFVDSAIPIFRLFDKGDEATFRNGDHLSSSTYIHPYSKEYRQSTLNYSLMKVCSCKFSPLKNKIHLVDLTIADASHYITDLNESQVEKCNSDNISRGANSIVNRNCGFEELTNWPTDECFELMKTCNRSSAMVKINGVKRKVPKRMRATTNPWGKGHAWIKKYFISAGKELDIVKTFSGGNNPDGTPRQRTRTWINSHVLENKTLHEADPDYLNILKSIKDPNKRKAWLYGSWDIVSGGIIGDLWDSDKHILKPFDIPQEWRIDRAYDHGSSSPFSCGWFAESDGSEIEIEPGEFKYFPKGSLILIHEWYGWNGEDNTGIYMNSTDIAENIMKIEKEYSLLKDHRVYPGPADNQIFNVEDGESIAGKMARIRKGKFVTKGIKWKRSNKNKGSRIIGLDLFRTMLDESLKPYKERPCFYVFDTCRDGFIRCVPSIPRDEKNPDDADTTVEDHTYDMVRYRILSRITSSKTQEI